MDYTEILGIKPGDSFEVVKKKAGRLFKKYHSDKCKDPVSAEKFKAIYEAYRYVRDNPSVLQNNDHEDKRYIAFTIKATIEDIYLGTKKHIVVKRDRYCSYCKGTGSDNGVSGKCLTCDGKGYVKGKVLKLMGMNDKCAVCSGTGRIEGPSCKKCHGSKIYTENITLSFVVSINSYKKKAVVLEGEGHQIGDNLFGNIMISLEIDETGVVGIEEDYFRMHTKILPIQTIIGDRSEIEMYGRRIPFNIEKGSTETLIEDRIKPGLTQKVRILFLTLQPYITEETSELYRKILEIEKRTFNDHKVQN